MASDLQYCVVLVTAGSQEEAAAIASALVEAKLAACISTGQIRSTYLWQGEVCQDAEWQLTVKTTIERFSELEQKIRQLHSYEVPEIIALPIVAGSSDYLQWLGDCLR